MPAKCTHSIVIFSLSFFLSSCASLGRDECLNAQWYSIGYEDGAKGYKTSRIGEHRKACSKYNVTPDLGGYTQGHSQGVIEWCTPENGFNQGRRGYEYNGICPDELQRDFVYALGRGKEIYDHEKEISYYDTEIRRLYTELDRVEEEIEYLEAELVSDNVRPKRRKYLLDEILTTEKDREFMQRDISDYEILVRELRQNLAELKRQNLYQ